MEDLINKLRKDLMNKHLEYTPENSYRISVATSKWKECTNIGNCNVTDHHECDTKERNICPNRGYYIKEWYENGTLHRTVIDTSTDPFRKRCAYNNVLPNNGRKGNGSIIDKLMKRHEENNS